MPQMAPIHWIFLFFYFTLIFIMFNITTYYNFNYKMIKYLDSMKSSKSLIWKW